MKTIKYHFLSIIFFALLLSCDDDAVDLPREIEIIGGHQVEVNDSILNFKYGLFNEQGLPATEFKEGEPILFSLWIENKSNTSLQVLNDSFDDLFRVFKLDGIDTRLDMGRPHSFICNKNMGWIFYSGETIKFQYPWVSLNSDIVVRNFLGCGGNNPFPLEPGTYLTSFKQAFDYAFAADRFKTDVLSFEIDFQVK